MQWGISVTLGAIFCMRTLASLGIHDYQLIAGLSVVLVAQHARAGLQLELPACKKMQHEQDLPMRQAVPYQIGNPPQPVIIGFCLDGAAALGLWLMRVRLVT